MKRLVLIVLLSFVGSFVGTVSAAEYGGIPQRFFAQLEAGEIDAAIDGLYGSNPWVKNNADQVVSLKSQLKNVNGLVGDYLFHELIVEERVGKHYAHLIYLVGYERQPLRFEIKVYKAGEKWRFHGVSFDAELTDDIEKAANRRLLQSR